MQKNTAFRTFLPGDIFRSNIKAGTELGKKAKSFIDQGLLVPDEVTIGMLLDRIHEADCKNGYILDGSQERSRRLRV